MSDRQSPFDEDAFWMKAVEAARSELARLDAERAARPQPTERQRREAQRRWEAWTIQHVRVMSLLEDVKKAHARA